MTIRNKAYEDEIVRLIELHLSRTALKHGFYFHIADMRQIARRLERDEDGVLSVLSDRELLYLKSLKNAKNRLQWISGRYAVKSAVFKLKLREQNIMDLRCLDVLKGADSAPFIPQYPDICVSITHSFPYCIAVVAKRRIGIDIERVFDPEDSLIRYFFSHREGEFLQSLKNTDEYPIRSAILWTRKEAVSKLFRLGMKMNFKELDTLKDEINFQGEGNVILSSFVCNSYCISLAMLDCGGS